MPRRVSLGFGAALLAVVVGAAASYRSLTVRHENVAAVTHAFASIHALEKLLGVLRDAETGQRGYLLTGDERYLKPYQSAMREEDATLAAFHDLVRADPEMEARLGGLEPLIRRKLAELERTVEIARIEGRQAALQIVLMNADMIRMEQIRDEISRMESIERAHLEERQRAWSRSIFVSNAILGGANLLLLVLITLAANLVRRELRDREAREAERARLIEMQQQLMGIVGHDLRSPLSAIMASAELLTRASDVPPGRLRAAHRIIQSGRRMDRMIRDLLDYTRARVEGGIPVRPRTADLSEICRRVVEELEADHPGRKIERSHRGEVTGEWDPDRLEQVISNLVSNALRYGRRDAPVRLVTEAVADAVSIEVHNEGPPIPPQLVPQLFEPFKRGSDTAGGVGLGLFIVRILVEGHGGRVEVRSREGEGTTFRVELPRWRSRPRHRSAPREAPAAEADLSTSASA